MYTKFCFPHIPWLRSLKSRPTPVFWQFQTTGHGVRGPCQWVHFPYQTPSPMFLPTDLLALLLPPSFTLCLELPHIPPPFWMLPFFNVSPRSDPLPWGKLWFFPAMSAHFQCFCGQPSAMEDMHSGSDGNFFPFFLFLDGHFLAACMSHVLLSWKP